MKPGIICKYAVPININKPICDTITYEIFHISDDLKSNHKYYPSHEFYMAVFPTTNSSGKHTIQTLKEYILPATGVKNCVVSVLPVENFRGHKKRAWKTLLNP